MKRPFAATLFVLALSVNAAAVAQELHTFTRIQLSDQFWSEGANFGDLNNDGENDIISGPWWWEGPDVQEAPRVLPGDDDVPAEARADDDRHRARLRRVRWARRTSTPTTSSSGSHDFNRDGWNDILIIGFPGQDTSWFENPKGKDGHWVRHKIFDQTDNESPTFADLTGDGKPELVCITKGQYGYAAPDWSDPAKPWTFHAISPNNKYGNFTHGMGLGDVNGDGRLDLLEKDGWWEQPASLAGDPVWRFHPPAHGHGRLADVRLRRQRRRPQRHHHGARRARLRPGVVRAVSRGRRDQVPRAHHHEQGSEGQRLRREVLRAPRHRARRHGRRRPEGHRHRQALLVARPHRRPGPQRRRPCSTGSSSRAAPTRRVDFVPYLIDNESGVGTQVVAGDINGDGLPDVVVGNKRGTFVHLHQKKTVTREEWEKAQPKRRDTQPGSRRGQLHRRESRHERAQRPYREAVVRRACCRAAGDGQRRGSTRRVRQSRAWTGAALALLGQVARARVDGHRRGRRRREAAGVSEDEIFELTVCAALGQATRQLDAALAALDAATPQGVRADAATP